MPFSIKSPSEARACFTLSTKSSNIPKIPKLSNVTSFDSVVVDITEPFSSKIHVSAVDSVVVDSMPNYV